MKFAKVMLLQVSVCPRGGGVRGCRGTCVVVGGGACMVARGHAMYGGMHGCQEARCGEGGACMAKGGVCGKGGYMAKGGVHGKGRRVCWGGVHGMRQDTEMRSMSGWYASY